MMRTSQIVRKDGRRRAKLVSIETMRHIASVLCKPEPDPIIESETTILKLWHLVRWIVMTVLSYRHDCQDFLADHLFRRKVADRQTCTSMPDSCVGF